MNLYWYSPDYAYVCQDSFGAYATNGDSGGPVFMVEDNGTATAVGVAAFYLGPVLGVGLSAMSNVTTDLGPLLAH